ncbi:hypothetical protein FOCG_03230 [Fusarium oxysporum f. sp. radicis-lycopersici 26381]|uniref:Uncharacterized protein n=1 Tax=Fusarium oxysporum Fo47 TaxID=660027 RepID=W9KH17_FUSOX|nr:hypothetical protein FOZG_06616 [Fusarium oxysporum Fo47]EXA01671.1 hypothetical protein FOWG_01429 [Fusarium oxysporum f. sp. lycopersici MN25]EXL60354.1 hypothetical protein FOCG_03230 [Fusarium oxysporum f. sp. radicis-lycopersici 26381]
MQSIYTSNVAVVLSSATLVSFTLSHLLHLFGYTGEHSLFTHVWRGGVAEYPCNSWAPIPMLDS